MRINHSYHVDLFMYCCHELLPDSLPPPVSFSPPKAPPISAPFVGILTLTIPQSEPFGPVHLNKFFKLAVKRELLSPCLTELLISIASSSVYGINENDNQTMRLP